MPCTVAGHVPLPMGFPRQEYWSGLPFPSPEDLPSTGIKLHLLHWQVESLLLSHREAAEAPHRPLKSEAVGVYQGISIYKAFRVISVYRQSWKPEEEMIILKQRPDMGLTRASGHLYGPLENCP